MQPHLFLLHDQSTHKPRGRYITVSYVCTRARAVFVQSAESQGRSRAGGTVVRSFPVGASLFSGLAVTTGHALVDTGAQSGVVGLYHWQLWVAALAYFGLQPVFKQVPPNLQAGGIGGGQMI